MRFCDALISLVCFLVGSTLIVAGALAPLGAQYLFYEGPDWLRRQNECQEVAGPGLVFSTLLVLGLLMLAGACALSCGVSFLKECNSRG